MDFILASASPRRQELLKNILESFSIVKSNFNEEGVLFNGDPISYVKETSKGKALDVYEILEHKQNKVIISCDTIVFARNKVLGKPKDLKEAFYMIEMLSGEVHEVYSGITVYNTSTDELIQEYAATKVKFMNLSKQEINRYIEKGESLDKAGAYGIQGAASIFIEEIHGCYYNVVGLPLNKLYNVLKEIRVI